MYLSVYVPRYFPILKRRPLKTKVHLVDTTTFSETCATIITLCRLLYYPRQQLLHSPLFPVSKRFSMWCRWRNNTELNHATYLLLRYWWYASFNSFYVVICLESWNKKEKCQSTYVVLLTIMKPYYWSVIFFVKIQKISWNCKLFQIWYNIVRIMRDSISTRALYELFCAGYVMRVVLCEFICKIY